MSDQLVSGVGWPIARDGELIPDKVPELVRT